MPMPEKPAPTTTTSVLVGHEVAATKSTTTRASSSPQSSWRKWPPPTMVVCGWPLRAGDALLQVAVGPLGDGVAVAEGAQEGPVEGGQAHPGGDVGVVGRVVGTRRHQHGELPARRPCRTRRGTARRRRPAPRRRARLGAAAAGRCTPVGNSSTSWEKRCQAKKASPGVGVAGGQEGVGGDHPGEAVGVLAHEAQADEPAPVLAHQRDVAQVEPVEEELAHPLDVAGERVVAALGRLVRAPEADQVGRDDLQPGRGEDRDHRAVQVGPGRLAVQQEDHGRLRVALAQVVHPQRAALAVGDSA